MSKQLPCLEDIGDVRGARVIVRSGLNVPVKDGVVRDPFRIERALPTIEYLAGLGARVIVVSHIGRDPEATLAPVHAELLKYIPVTYVPSLEDEHIHTAIDAMTDGSVLLLENLRSTPEETENNAAFATRLASYGDIFVNDAFSVSHREHASIVGMPKYLPSYAGLNFEQEYEELVAAMEPESPSLFILGGAKFETKGPLIEKYIKKYDYVFVGGALANDFFSARGHEIGASLHSDVDLSDGALISHSRILLPTDVTVKSGEGSRVTAPELVLADERILDAGPETIAMLGKYIAEAKTILWNGPLGDYEHGFSKYTEECAVCVGKSNAHSVIGGGDTIASITSLGIDDQIDFLSTAGGAMLVFLETGTLSGIEALQNQSWLKRFFFRILKI